MHKDIKARRLGQAIGPCSLNDQTILVNIASTLPPEVRMRKKVTLANVQNSGVSIFTHHLL